MSLNIGETKRLESGSQWELTILDICDLMDNYRKESALDDKKEYASRSISFVLGNLQRRGIIEDQFINIKEDNK